MCINTIHIVAWAAVEKLFAGAGKTIGARRVLYAYGPYRYADRPLEPSNEDFDKWLKARDPVSGVRDFEAVDALARQNGLVLAGDRAMPANNRSIWWRKPESKMAPALCCRGVQHRLLVTPGRLLRLFLGALFLHGLGRLLLPLFLAFYAFGHGFCSY